MAGGYYSVCEVQTTGGAFDAFDLYPNHSAIIFKPIYMMAVYNRWTGLVDRTSGLDYWTDVFSLETQI